uniref:MEG-27 protein n=1 Tax=Schistosoma mansoni TaxID=6183 RepID=A0A5K4F014_SCHMA
MNLIQTLLWMIFMMIMNLTNEIKWVNCSHELNEHTSETSLRRWIHTVFSFLFHNF